MNMYYFLAPLTGHVTMQFTYHNISWNVMM